MNAFIHGVCWHDGRHRCDDFHDDRVLASYGRCRSGSRWFWSAHSPGDGPGAVESGRADTAEEAEGAARKALVRLAAGRPAVAVVTHGQTRAYLKHVNARKRAAAASDSTGTDTIEYLYSVSPCHNYDDNCRCRDLKTARERYDYHLCRWRITRKTPRRIYYVRRVGTSVFDVSGTEVTAAYVDREKIEATGEIRRKGGHWWENDYHLYLEPPDVPGDPTPDERAELLRLKQAMAAAHPDRGGTDEAFRQARARYVAAKGTLAAR